MGQIKAFSKPLDYCSIEQKFQLPERRTHKGAWTSKSRNRPFSSTLLVPNGKATRPLSVIRKVGSNSMPHFIILNKDSRETPLYLRFHEKQFEVKCCREAFISFSRLLLASKLPSLHLSALRGLSIKRNCEPPDKEALIDRPPFHNPLFSGPAETEYPNKSYP